MDIDLVTIRNLQLFVRLAALPCDSVKSCMEWQLDQIGLFLEIQKQRLCLTTGWLNPTLNEEDLYYVQQRWRLERFQGIPQRIYLLSKGIMISCCPYAASGAELWYALYQQQRLLLNSLQGKYQC